MKKSAIMVLLDQDLGGRLKTLMMTRSEGKLHAGQMCFPGGKCDWIEEIVKIENDYSSTLSKEVKITKGRWETYEEAATRECLEETGYKTYLFGELPHMPYYADGEFIGKVFVAKIQHCRLESNIIYPNPEHSNCDWYYLDDLRSIITNLEYDHIYGPITKAIIEVLTD